ncbi:MAG: ABC transporter permease [Actinomycetota bacterium]|nr:MAG: ABC transporter permease [Actinomycetota bacterium]
MSTATADDRISVGNAERIVKEPAWLRWMRVHSKVVYGISGVAIVLIAWQVTSTLGLVNVTIASDPIRVIKAEITLFSSGQIWGPIGVTAQEVGWGMLITLLISIPLGLILGRVTALYDMTEPIINVLNSVPYVLFLPVIIFWFGIGQQSRILLVIWAATMPLIINTTAGVRNLNSDYIRVAKMCCAGKWTFYRSVLFPATLPYILTGIRLSIARALVGAIVAEFFLSGGGLGYFVQTATSNFDMDSAMAGIFIMAVAAVVLTRLIGRLEHRYTHWSQG